MENEFPSNSRKQTPEPEAKKIVKVTEGDVVRRKKPLGKKFAETFAGGDARATAGYVLLEVLVPAAKDMIADAVSQGVERMIFGEARSAGRRTGARPANYTSYGSANKYSNNYRAPRDAPPNPSRRSRATHNFDEIILPTRFEADAVIDGLFELISKYELATVADLYGIVGVTGDYTDEKWGWTDIRGIGVKRVREGYLLDIPKPEPLD